MAEVEFNVVDAIDRLVAMGSDAGKAHKNASNFTHAELKLMAVHLEIPKTMSKSELVDAVIAKKSNQVALGNILQTIESSDSEDEAVDVRFIRNKNTIPRLCNLFAHYPIQVQRSNLLATRAQLQHREINSRQSVFVTVAEEFNDETLNSGGLVFRHEEFLSRGIDPEGPRTGKIGVYKVFKEWRALVKKYAECRKRFEVSGQSNGLDFYLFCQGDVDVLYLHRILQKLGDAQLTSYCREGSEIEGGLDSTSPSVSTTSASGDIPRSDGKRGRDKALMAIADSLSAKSKMTLEDSISKRAVNDAMAKKHRQELIHSLWMSMGETEDVISQLEAATDYDSDRPTKKLLRYRAEFDRAEGHYKQLTATTDVVGPNAGGATPVQYSTPN